jgi:hypothetical protein
MCGSLCWYGVVKQPPRYLLAPVFLNRGSDFKRKGLDAGYFEFAVAVAAADDFAAEGAACDCDGGGALGAFTGGGKGGGNVHE